MNKILRNGIVLPVALGTLLATSLGAAASPAPRDPARQDQSDRQQKRQDRQDARKERRADRQEARQENREDRREVRQAMHQAPQVRPVIVRPGHPAVVRQDRQDRRQDRREDRQDRRQDRRDDRQDRREDRREARHDIREDRRDYRRDLRERRAHEQYRNDYYRRMRTYQSHRYTPRWYHGGNYRYLRGGHWYRVNYYAADMLRNAVDQGYREGLRAGRADRYDGWRGGYRNSTVWMDANFGYMGSYVSRSEYNYYFRQGFERGYEDGMYGRNRYGRYVNGEMIIIDAVLSTILNLQRY